MNIKEMLKLADEIVFTQTDQHLDDLQAAILQGTLQRETYKEIAKNFDCSESRIREVGAELWRILSEELGEEINKSNFRSTIERWQNSNILNFAQDIVVSSSFNTCGSERHPPEIPNFSQFTNQETSNSKPSQTPHQDLSEMPELGAFYNRTSELETLKTWILEQRCHLMTITGISGIGKTTLAVQLVDQIKDEFEYVLWCSLASSPTFAEFQEQLIQFFSESETIDSSRNNRQTLSLIKYLQKYRCLVVLDDVHHLFSSGEFAGKYQPGYEEYRLFFKQVEQLSHQSCLLLIGWEPAVALPKVSSPKTAIFALQLTGLDRTATQAILRDYGLSEIEKYSGLIPHYQGNPLWLKSVALQIQELGESITDLLPDDTILLPEDLKEVLDLQFNRLSPIEKQLLFLLAKESTPVNLAKLLENSPIEGLDLRNGLQSLLRRGLIEKIDNLYMVYPVLRQYITQKQGFSQKPCF
ncbi:NB-ARC domain-containing protein [Laspinema olomoucense]|uniref:NB-ARC domain-containing protein n=1 Tax=Laspinema olomoucense TaxID=3231600 RepID=UPI0021BA7529|nr:MULTISPECIES: NB-ARC domain-containing protein [unclassified Laspinema]MCT7989804.1 NB-ARC domain-containing protein [Laspinema sp. D3a]MCT7996965.1 NB-ARC domain-containing protein [Laspinema sp. D3c]